MTFDDKKFSGLVEPSAEEMRRLHQSIAWKYIDAALEERKRQFEVALRMKNRCIMTCGGCGKENQYFSPETPETLGLRLEAYRATIDAIEFLQEFPQSLADDLAESAKRREELETLEKEKNNE